MGNDLSGAFSINTAVKRDAEIGKVNEKFLGFFRGLFFL
jgi:hypothetical protein